MSETKNLKYYARYYFLNNDGRLVTQDREIYSSNICAIMIPEQCMYIEILSVNKNLRSVTPKDVQCEERYLIGKRFDRARSNFKNDAEKFGFVMQKVYRPHIELDERKIKNGKYVIAQEDQGEA